MTLHCAASAVQVHSEILRDLPKASPDIMPWRCGQTDKRKLDSFNAAVGNEKEGNGSVRGS
jgi:hypothetical protein